MLLLDVFLRKTAALEKLSLVQGLYSSMTDCPPGRQESTYNVLVDQELKLIELIKNCNVIIGSAEASIEVTVDKHRLKLKDLREWFLAAEQNIIAIDRLVKAGIKVINLSDILAKRETYLSSYIKYKSLYDETVATTDTDNIGKPEEE